jgi:tubulin-specific chaperone B
VGFLVWQTVRYWGPVPELGDGEWVGVDLENPVGDSDGSISGHVYFEAKPNHAIFVSPTVVTVSGVEPVFPVHDKGSMSWVGSMCSG